MPKRLIFALLPALLAAGQSLAHQVPSLTVEALFLADRSYTLQVSLDPRLFLSDQPASLPPVPVEWYREQTPEQLTATWHKAAGYVREALELKFGQLTGRIGGIEFQPMDGATNEPLGADSKEVHLLGKAKGVVPEGGGSFQIALGRNANVSMILLNSLDGEMERRPNVIFPGETSRPFELKFAAVKSEPQAPAREPHATAQSTPAASSTPPVAPPADSQAGAWEGHGWLIASLALLAAAAWSVLKLRRKTQ